VKLSGCDLTPIGGGRFLIVESTSDIHGKLDKARSAVRTPGGATTVPDVVAQIIPLATDAITEFVEHHLSFKVLARRSWCSSAPIS
jgi:hypothetical protein